MSEPTKTITLPLSAWEKIKAAVNTYEDEGTYRGEASESEALRIAKSRFLIALVDAPEVNNQKTP